MKTSRLSVVHTHDCKMQTVILASLQAEKHNIPRLDKPLEVCNKT